MTKLLELKENLGRATFDVLGYLKDKYNNQKVVHLDAELYDTIRSHPVVEYIYSKRIAVKQLLDLLPYGSVEIPEGDCFLLGGAWFCKVIE